jgi:hypothetical protein
MKGLINKHLYEKGPKLPPSNREALQNRSPHDKIVPLKREQLFNNGNQGVPLSRSNHLIIRKKITPLSDDDSP